MYPDGCTRCGEACNVMTLKYFVHSSLERNFDEESQPIIKYRQFLVTFIFQATNIRPMLMKNNIFKISDAFRILLTNSSTLWILIINAFLAHVNLRK